MIPEQYSEYRGAFFNILEPFQDMWDGHSGNTNIATHLIELKSPYIRPINSATYRTERKARESKKEEIKRM